MSLSSRALLGVAVASVAAGCASGGVQNGVNVRAEPMVSAAIGNVRYEVAFDSAAAADRTLHVAMSFTTASDAPVVLSLPAWTPGAYEISNYARWTTNFRAEAGGRALQWDKLGYDTWRVQPGDAREVTVSFDYYADSLDNAMAWARDDFAFFNGTNVFLYPEGQPT